MIVYKMSEQVVVFSSCMKRLYSDVQQLQYAVGIPIRIKNAQSEEMKFIKQWGEGGDWN
jgi:hypothetical protein